MKAPLQCNAGRSTHVFYISIQVTCVVIIYDCRENGNDPIVFVKVAPTRTGCHLETLKRVRVKALVGQKRLVVLSYEYHLPLEQHFSITAGRGAHLNFISC